MRVLRLGEDARDLVLLVAVVAGALLQSALGGPWLLVIGGSAAGLRVAFSLDDRRCLVSTVVVCVFWTLLHILQATGLTRSQVLAEVVAFYGMLVLFWWARLRNRERAAADAARLDGMKASTADLARRMDQLKVEAAGLDKESDDWAKLFGIARNIGEVMRAGDMYDLIGDVAERQLRMPAHALLVERDGAAKVVTEKGFDRAAVAEANFAPDAASLASWLMRQREPVLVDSIDQDRRFAGAAFPFRSMVALPMRVQDRALGVLVAFDAEERTFTRQDFQRMESLSRQLALGMSKSILYEREEEMSLTDGLTKLYRRRFFQERFDSELDRARRYSRPLSLIMLDLDDFKKYNDSYGHPAGDDLLRRVARAMEATFKRPSILCRFGGEEFAVMIPEAPKEAARDAAEAFRSVVEEAGRDEPGGRNPVTVSAGVATFPSDAQTRRDLIARADLALYRAKGEGRNRVCSYDPAVDREDRQVLGSGGSGGGAGGSGGGAGGRAA